ncbi:hypothetical protein [Sinomonas atrocyanea]
MKRAPALAHYRTRTAEAALHAHPSNHIPTVPPRPATEEELAGRWNRLHATLVRAGLDEEQAWTEVARIAAGELWSEAADQLREHRAAAQREDARAFALALQSVRGVLQPLTLRPGDLPAARTAVTKARLRLQHNGELLQRLQRPHPAFERTGQAFAALEAFLAPGSRPSGAGAASLDGDPRPRPRRGHISRSGPRS